MSVFEDDTQTVDRIAKLHTVGSAIAPLIYGLSKTSDFSEFLNAYESVWKAIEDENDLELSESLVR